MLSGFFSKGPIQLYALPGTEEYVKKVANHIIDDLLSRMEQNNVDIKDFFQVEEDYNNFPMDNKKEIKEFFLKFIIGEFSYFPHRNGAIEISINSSARRRDIYVFHTFSEADIRDNCGKQWHLTLSDQEILLYNTLDAFLEAKVNRVTLFEMNLGQARSDRPKGRGACNLRTFFRNITANGANHFFTYQIHSSKSLIGIDNTKTTYDNLSGQSILIEYILEHHVVTKEFFKNAVQKEWIFSSVDAGGKEFAAMFAKSFMTPLLVVDKRRNPLTNVIEEITILKPESLNIKDKIVFIVDDMIDSGGSIVDVCRKYRELGAREVNVAVVFGIFSPPAEKELNSLIGEGALNKVIITDLITHNSDFLKRNPFIEIVDTTLTSASIIMKTNRGKSLEKYFLQVNAEDYLK